MFLWEMPCTDKVFNPQGWRHIVDTVAIFFKVANEMLEINTLTPGCCFLNLPVTREMHGHF